MAITENKQPYGEFASEIENGAVNLLHIPSGHCLEWTDGGWSGGDLYRKMIATIPGMLRPIHPSQEPNSVKDDAPNGEDLGLGDQGQSGG